MRRGRHKTLTLAVELVAIDSFRERVSTLKTREKTSEMTPWVKALGVFSLMIWVSFPRSTWKKARTDSHVLCSHPYTNAMELAQPHTHK